MLSLLEKLFDTDSLAPHGTCLLWRPELIWMHVISDSIIVLAYYSIPIVLVYFVRRRPDVGFGWVFWCFASFIMACGTTHLVAIWTLWRPDYAAEGLVKAATASASIATAGALWPLLPQVLKLPSPAQLRGLNAELTLLVAERDRALDDLRRESAERAQAEQMLRQSQKMEALGQVATGVAHDFNNLLGVVLLNLERLERDLPPERARRARATAAEAARRAAGLTGQMLSYARRQPLQQTRLDLAGFVASLRDLAADALGSERTLRLEPAGGPCPVLVDKAELTSALLNLLVNARDATQPGGTVAVRLERQGERVALTVADDGMGMDAEVQSRAFDPFFTTKDAGKGSGLGLSQVFGFARSSGGEARLASAPGAGTAVTILLPLAEAA